jgi:hypothetical protein
MERRGLVSKGSFRWKAIRTAISVSKVKSG